MKMYFKVHLTEGSQTLPVEVESGAYFVQITGESGSPVHQKVYPE